MIDYQNKDLEALYSPRRYDLWSAINKLQQGTPSDLVKTRSIQGRNVPFISGDAVVLLLNNLFNYQWSFTVIEHKVELGRDKKSKDNVAGIGQSDIVHVLGRLTIPGLGVREQWGSDVLKGGSDVQQSSYKSATTDALKKCAYLFGVGLDVSNNFTPNLRNLNISPWDIVDESKNQEQIETFIEKATKKKMDLIEQQRAARGQMVQQRQQQAQPQQQQQAPVQQQAVPEQQAPTQQPMQAPQQQEWPTTPPVQQEAVTHQQTQVAQQEQVRAQEATKQKVSIPMKITEEETQELKKLMLEGNIHTIQELEPIIQHALNNPQADFSSMDSSNVDLIYIELMKYIETSKAQGV